MVPPKKANFTVNHFSQCNRNVHSILPELSFAYSKVSLIIRERYLKRKKPEPLLFLTCGTLVEDWSIRVFIMQKMPNAPKSRYSFYR